MVGNNKELLSVSAHRPKCDESIIRVSFRIFYKGGHIQICTTIGGGAMGSYVRLTFQKIPAIPRGGKPDSRGGPP